MSLDQTSQRYRAAVQARFLQSKTKSTPTPTTKAVDKQLEDVEEMEAVPPGVPTIVPSEANEPNEEQPAGEDNEHVDVDLYEDEFEEVDDDACCCKDVDDDDEDDEEDEDECCEDDQYVDFDDDESVQTGCGDFDDEDDGMDDDELIASICAQEINTPPPSPPAPTVTEPKAKRGRKPKPKEQKEAKPKGESEAKDEGKSGKKAKKSTKKKPQNEDAEEEDRPETKKKKPTKKKAKSEKNEKVEKADAAKKKRPRAKKAAAVAQKASEETESDDAAEEPARAASKPKRARTRKVVDVLRTLGQYERRIRTVATEEELSGLHGAFLTDFGLEAAIKRWRADTKKAEDAGQTVPYVHQAQVLAAVAHEKGYRIAGFTSENKVKGEFKPLPEGHTRATANVVYVGKVARGYGQTLWTLHKDDIIHEGE